MKLQAIEARLRKQLAQLEERLAHVKKDMSKSHSADWAEQAVERENDEVLGGIGQETQAAIADIHAALTKIGAGTYGVCSKCGKAINPDRLEVLPAAAFCLSCATG